MTNNAWRGRGVLILGAASAIAEAVARDLAAQGAQLMLVARDEARLEAIAADLRLRGSPNVAVRALDLVESEPTDELLQSLADDLKFVLITSAAEAVAGDALQVAVTPSSHAKCERCWHYRADVGINPEHPGLCGRCDSNLHGQGEVRSRA